MNMIEALEWAADFAARTKMWDAPLNKNGYAVDGFKGVAPREKVEIIVGIAAQVCDADKGLLPANKTAGISMLYEWKAKLGEAYTNCSWTKVASVIGEIEHTIRYLEEQDG